LPSLKRDRLFRAVQGEYGVEQGLRLGGGGQRVLPCSSTRFGVSSTWTYRAEGRGGRAAPLSRALGVHSFLE